MSLAAGLVRLLEAVLNSHNLGKLWAPVIDRLAHPNGQIVFGVKTSRSQLTSSTFKASSLDDHCSDRLLINLGK